MIKIVKEVMNYGLNHSFISLIDRSSIHFIILFKFVAVGDTPLFSQLINVSPVTPMILANSLI